MEDEPPGQPDHREAETILPQAPGADGGGARSPISPRGAGEPGVLRRGSRLGRYTLLELLGEGGFGVVWRAEQREPVKREVAVKIIKPGMDSAAVLARFEQERQTLAVMDHPYVARVFDAGVTPPDSDHPGLPYFVMELVRGEPITQYCDRAKLSVTERLKLFMKVCEAVQHAHTKAVIHRDLKPSNVLVTLQGTEPTPKVIDFGVAKALTGTTGPTLFTEAGSMIGTPEYMSPEQAAGGVVDVDTRADVYSLGVMLYELLTGARPFDLRRATIMEIQRVIRDEEPRRPSTRLLTRDGGAAHPDSAAVATHMRTDSRSLARVLRSDLDWVVMRCLEKDRARRYSSASALVEDLQRYLEDQPVLAGPPSAAYRARKFVKRHRAGVVAGGVVAATLAAAMVAVSAGLVREAGLRKRAETERDTAEAVVGFLQETLSGVKPELARGSEVTVREMLDRAADKIGASFDGRPVVAGRLRNTIGESYEALSKYPEAEAQFRAAYQSLLDSEGPHSRDTLIAMNNLAIALHDLGRFDEARKLHEESVALHREVLGENDPDTLSAESNYALLLLDVGEKEKGKQLYEQILAATPGRDSPIAWEAMTGLAWLAKDRGDMATALPLYREVYERSVATLGDDHPDAIVHRGNYAQALVAADRWDEAVALLRGQVERAERVLGPEHADTLISYNNLALLLQDVGELDEAMTYFQKVLDASPRVFARTHPLPARAMVNMAGLCYRTGDLERAADLLREACDRFDLAQGQDDTEALDARTSLAVVLNALGKLDESVRIQRAIYETSLRAHGADDVRTLVAQSELAAGLRDLGEYDEAAQLFAAASEASKRVLGEDSDQSLMTAYQYTGLLTRMERWEDALRESEWLVAHIDSALPPSHPVALLGHYRLGTALVGLGRYEKAERALLESWRRLEAVEGISPAWKGYVAEAMAGLYEKWGRGDEAAVWRARAESLNAPAPGTAEESGG